MYLANSDYEPVLVVVVVVDYPIYINLSGPGLIVRNAHPFLCVLSLYIRPGLALRQGLLPTPNAMTLYLVKTHVRAPMIAYPS